MTTPKKVLLLKGGWSAEREVSLTTAIGIEQALKNLGYAVDVLDLQDDLDELIQQLKSRPDVVFNALHGRWGEDGFIQGILNFYEIPYTHSGQTASALAMQKDLSLDIFKAHGLPVAESKVVDIFEAINNPPLAPPYVIKPVNEGSSVGVHIVYSNTKPNLDPHEWPYDPKVLVERYIPGRELSVAVLDGRALGVLELRPRAGLFYNYEAKYTDGITEHFMPAPVPENIYMKVMEIGEKAHKILGCRGVTRCDIRYNDEEGEAGIYLLELNTQPGFTPLSIAPEIAAYAGIPFDDLIGRMVEGAACDK